MAAFAEIRGFFRSLLMKETATQPRCKASAEPSRRILCGFGSCANATRNDEVKVLEEVNRNGRHVTFSKPRRRAQLEVFEKG